ncbi:hypothetical protein BC828DRAFT_415832 [Blastocladiella britannica]|nr:hypothetical protein BC828DRAFT_415832 [Blastocladiella britannica]
MVPSKKSWIRQGQERFVDFSSTKGFQWWCGRVEKGGYQLLATMSERSRIFVKNLPKYITDDRLRDHFSATGAVTDVKLLRTPDGQPRRIAFIGFRSEKDAKAAVAHFKKGDKRAYIDTTPIEVELAKPINDPSLPRAWSKYTKGTTAYDRAHPSASDPSSNTLPAVTTADETAAAAAKKSFVDSLNDEAEARPALATYLELLKPRAAKAAWQNDDVGGDNVRALVGKKTKKERGPKTVTQTVANRKPGGEGLTVTRSMIVFDDDEEDSDEEYQSVPTGGFAKSAVDAKGDDATSDSKPTSGATAAGNDDGDGDADAMDVDDDSSPAPAPPAPPTAAAPPAPAPRTTIVPWSLEAKDADLTLIQQTGRLYIINVPYAATDKDLMALFQPFGALAAIHIPLNRETKQPKGIAFVTFVAPAHAVAAYESLQASFFMGRVMTLRGAQPEKQAAAATATDGADGKNNNNNNKKIGFKAERDAARKADAGKGYNWNSLFMASNAVAEAMAARLGVDKSQLLDRNSDDMAVRLAVAETHVISETKVYLEEQGIDLSTFDRSLRSDSVMIVKNITYGTTEKELATLCKPFGELGRLVLPPAGTIAVVEFLAANDAKVAFRHLAYKKFKALPLYVEWAPRDCFSATYDPVAIQEKKEKQEREAQEAASLNGGGDASSSATTTAKPGSKKRMRSAALLGEDDVDETVSVAAGDGENTKLMVRNVPFEATLKDLRSLFSPFAHVKSVRLPKKVTGGHRGFAFAEFVTHGEAVEAMRKLRHTHLYGRRLVIEFARKGESVEELRERTKRVVSVGGSGGDASKRARVDMEAFTGRKEGDGAAGSGDEDDME